MWASSTEWPRLNLQRTTSWPALRTTAASFLSVTKSEHVPDPNDTDPERAQLSISPRAATNQPQPPSPTCDHESGNSVGSHGQSSAQSLLTNVTHHKPPSSRTDAQHEVFESSLSIAHNSTSSRNKTVHTSLLMSAPAELEKDEVDAIIIGVQQIARDRSNAIEIRSGAQEEGRHFNHLHSQLAAQIAPVFEMISKGSASIVGDDWDLLVQSMNSAKDLLAQIGMSAKAFNKAQNRVQILEWRILEAEEGLYAPYATNGSPVPVIDDLDELPSELSSAPLSPQLDYLLPLGDDIMDYTALSLEPESKSGDNSLDHSLVQANAERTVDNYETSTSFDEPVNIPLPPSNPDHEVVQLTTPHSQNSQQNITQQAEKRLLLYGRARDPEETIFEGFQFDAIQEETDLTSWSGSHLFNAETMKRLPVNYNMMGFTQWVVYGTPWCLWNSTTFGYRHRAYFLPVGIRFLQALMLNNFEATCLGLSSAPRVKFMKGVDEDIQATRVALMNSWLWEPTYPVTDVSQSAITMSLPENRKQTSSTQANGSVKNIPQNGQQYAPTTPRPKPVHNQSIGTIMPLERHSAADSPLNGNIALSEEEANGFDATTLLASHGNNASLARNSVSTRRMSLP